MGTISVVLDKVLLQDPEQVVLVKNDDVLETLPPQHPDRLAGGTRLTSRNIRQQLSTRATCSASALGDNACGGTQGLA